MTTKAKKATTGRPAAKKRPIDTRLMTRAELREHNAKKSRPDKPSRAEIDAESPGEE